MCMAGFLAPVRNFERNGGRVCFSPVAHALARGKLLAFDAGHYFENNLLHKLNKASTWRHTIRYQESHQTMKAK